MAVTDGLPRFVTRRAFLQAAGASIAGAAGVTSYASLIEPHWLDMVRRPLPIRYLPAAMRGRTLVQISDIHVGTQVDDDYVVASFERITALRPDVVVLTGDLIGYHPAVFEQLARVFRSFPKGRLATLATLGNHDYGPRWSYPEIADRVVRTVSPLGITVLRNECRDVGGLQIVGLDDMWSGRLAGGRAMRGRDPGRAAIVLSHNPDTADLPIWEGYHGWILSGHTHGGQCRPPFLPPPILPVQNKRYAAGVVALADERQLYINRGLGHLLQVRFNVRPEVTVFELQPA